MFGLGVVLWSAGGRFFVFKRSVVKQFFSLNICFCFFLTVFIAFFIAFLLSTVCALVVALGQHLAERGEAKVDGWKGGEVENSRRGQK